MATRKTLEVDREIGGEPLPVVWQAKDMHSTFDGDFGRIRLESGLSLLG